MTEKESEKGDMKRDGVCVCVRVRVCVCECVCCAHACMHMDVDTQDRRRRRQLLNFMTDLTSCKKSSMAVNRNTEEETEQKENHDTKYCLRKSHLPPQMKNYTSHK